MVNGLKNNPGGWVTKKKYTSLAEARREPAILHEFTSAKGELVIQAYRIDSPIPVRAGIAGPQISKDKLENYSGGGQQFQLLIDRVTDGTWQKYMTLLEEIRL